MKIFYLSLFILPIFFISYGQTFWKKISAGTEYSIALRSDSTLWSWGINNNGQLGTGGSSTELPEQIGSDHDWTDISCGGFHALALKANGTLWGWGSNAVGQVSVVQLQQITSPVQIGSDQDWEQIATGTGHSAAIKSNGTLWMWGNNFSGQLGNGANVNLNAPTQVGQDTDWAYVSLGGAHTLALKSDSTLFAWGNNSLAQLGNNTLINEAVPVQITNHKWISVEAGFASNGGVLADGTAWTWGFNANGQLGQGDTQNRLVPTQLGTGNTWLHIFVGSCFMYGLMTDASVWSWGFNGQGQLGIGTLQAQNLPVPVSLQAHSKFALAEGGTDASGSALYGLHVLSIAPDSLSICSVGANYAGQLGIGNTLSRSSFECDVASLANTEILAQDVTQIYPNPSSGQLYIEATSALHNATLTDAQGRMLHQFDLQTGLNQFNFLDLLPGSYFIQTGTSVLKWVVE
jgi:alpha-tubulin suppressor-like RCC1 family protein